MLRARRKAARPDDRIEAALRADYLKQEEQRSEEQKAHELLYVHHPRAGSREKAEPGGLRAKQEIGRAHSRCDRDKHERE